MSLIGAALREYRIKNRITAKDMARFMGINPNYLWRVENNRVVPGKKVMDGFDRARKKFESGEVRRSAKKDIFKSGRLASAVAAAAVATDDLTDRPETFIEPMAELGSRRLIISDGQIADAKELNASFMAMVNEGEAAERRKKLEEMAAKFKAQTDLQTAIKAAMELNPEGRAFLIDLLQRLG